MTSSIVCLCERKSIVDGRDKIWAQSKNSVRVILPASLYMFASLVSIHGFVCVIFPLIQDNHKKGIQSKRYFRSATGETASSWILLNVHLKDHNLLGNLRSNTSKHRLASWCMDLKGSNGLEVKYLPSFLWFACEIDFIGFILLGSKSVSPRSINKRITRNRVDMMIHKARKRWLNVSKFYITAVILQTFDFLYQFMVKKDKTL